MRINYQKNHIGMLAVVFSLMAITLYMAFAFPYSLLHFKQSETTEIKAVIIIGRHGEVTPSKEAYFDAHGEEPPQVWFTLGGPNQLTSVGKERMYLLGKFLKLHYYERLLQGNPRRLYVRSENSDKILESTQALLAGLNQPKDKWIWLHGDSGTVDAEFAASWQPKAIHTMPELQDDLLSSQCKCLQMDTYKANWKNSTRYLQLLNEFRHDLQILRQNTGLEFDDDLEILANIESHLRARSAFDNELEMPSWYTSTLAQRLAHIADVTAGCRFSQTSSQRLYVGRLLDTVIKNIFAKIRSDLTSGVSLLNNEHNGNNSDDNTDDDDNDSAGPGLDRSESFNITNTKIDRAKGSGRSTSSRNREEERATTTLTAVGGESKLLPPDEQIKLKLERQMEPSMFIYMTDKQHLTALMNSLKIYSSQPNYGALLIIELHHDPVNQVHFLRLFTVNSASHNVLPEPVRVNPIACLDAVECSPQQFEKNVRHLTLDKQTWQSLCSNIDKYENDQLLQLLTSPTTNNTTTTPPTSPPISVGPTLKPGATSASTTNSPLGFITNKPTIVIDANEIEDILGPTERSDATPTNRPPSGASIGETSTSARPIDAISDSIHLDKLDESLIVGPTKTTVSTESSSDELGGLTTELVAGTTDSVLTTTISDDIKPTTMEASNLVTESPNHSTSTTTTTTNGTQGEETTLNNASGMSLPAGDETTTTTTTSTTLAPTMGTSIELDYMQNDPKTNEIIGENHLARDTYVGENDV